MFMGVTGVYVDVQHAHSTKSALS